MERRKHTSAKVKQFAESAFQPLENLRQSREQILQHKCINHEQSINQEIRSGIHVKKVQKEKSCQIKVIQCGCSVALES